VLAAGESRLNKILTRGNRLDAVDIEGPVLGVVENDEDGHGGVEEVSVRGVARRIVG
jgi:hypothetical protein